MSTKPAQPSPIRHWSALAPLGMSLAGLAMVLIWAAAAGVEPHEDEGAPARIFQLLMTAQLPVVLYFAIRWLPQRTRQALVVLVLQGLAWLAAVGAIFFIERAAQ